GRRFKGAQERMLPNDGINPHANFVCRGLAHVLHLDLGLDLTVIPKIQPRLRYAHVGSQLLFGGIAGKFDGVLRGLGLPLKFDQCAKGYQNSQTTYSEKSYVWGVFRTKETLEI